MKKKLDPKLPIPVLGDPSTPDPAVKPDGYQDRLNRRLFELFREFDDGTVAIYDEGTYLGQADGLNFIGTPVTATNSATLPSGIFDITVTSTGGGGTIDTLSVTASENVSAGALINIWSSSGTFKGRNADASKGAGYEAHGWTDSAILSGSTITVRFLGKNTHSTGLTPGPVFLGNGGLATSTPPTTAGYISQEVGAAESSSSFAFEWHPDILLAAAHSTFTGGVLQSVTITSSQTWTLPAGVSAGWIDMYGGGGGGGGGVAGGGGGGGGSAEYCQGFLVPLTANPVIVIGAGGAASSAGGAGNAGGNTTFNDGTTTWTVLGGGAGAAGAAGTGGGGGGIRGGTQSVGVGQPGTAETPYFFGGSGGGTGASSHANGGGSAGRLTGGAGGSATNGGGGGGATPLGTGGAGGNSGANNGSDAPTANSGCGGGGGGGGVGNTTGGAGAAGKVVIYYIA